MNEAAGNSEEFYRSRIRELEADVALKEQRVRELEDALTPFCLLPKKAAIVRACDGLVNFNDIDLAHKVMGEEVSEEGEEEQAKDPPPEDLSHTLRVALRVLHDTGGRGMRLTYPWRSRFWGLIKTLDTSRLVWEDETASPEAAVYRSPCLVPTGGYVEQQVMDVLIERGFAEVRGEIAKITESGRAMWDELRFNGKYEH